MLAGSGHPQTACSTHAFAFSPCLFISSKCLGFSKPSNPRSTRVCTGTHSGRVILALPSPYALSPCEYLVLTRVHGSAAAAAFIFLGTLARSGWSALLGMLLSELAIAFSDVVVDGIVVERARNEPVEVAGALQSLCWGSEVSHACCGTYASRAQHVQIQGVCKRRAEPGLVMR